MFTPEKRSEIMSKIRGKNTKIEILLRKALWRNEIRGYRVHFGLPGKPDIVFPKYKVAVFCDGDFWHGYNFNKWKDRLPPYWFKKIKGNIERDKKNNRMLKQKEWTLIHFWEHQIEKNLEKCKQKVIDVLVDKGYKNEIPRT